MGGNQVDNHATLWSNLQDCKISSRVEIPKLDPSVAIYQKGGGRYPRDYKGEGGGPSNRSILKGTKETQTFSTIGNDNSLDIITNFTRNIYAVLCSIAKLNSIFNFNFNLS